MNLESEYNLLFSVYEFFTKYCDTAALKEIEEISISGVTYTIYRFDGKLSPIDTIDLDESSLKLLENSSFYFIMNMTGESLDCKEEIFFTKEEALKKLNLIKEAYKVL